MSAAESVCRVIDCQVAKTGKCKLNHDPIESCPDFRSSAEGLEDVTASDEVGEEISETAPCALASGDVLDISGLTQLLRSEMPRVVALVGAQRAGKTTLLASLFASYCRGPFAGLDFASSRTLIAFAKRHHLALLASGRKVPTTPRTSRNDPVGFFHLALSRGAGRLEHLVVSDRSGEAFEAARIDTSLIAKLTEIRQAQRVCFLLDGARLLSADQWASYSRHFKQMIRALCDNHALDPGVAVEVLTTKYDKLRSAPDSENLYRILMDYEQRLIADFSSIGLTIDCYRVCALPRSDYTVGQFGLAEMVRRWTAPRIAPDVTPRPPYEAFRQIDRVFGHWFPTVSA